MSKVSWRPVLVLLSSLVFFSCLAGCQPGDVPEDIYFRDNQVSLNSRYYIAAYDGDIWIKPNRQFTGEEGPWRKLKGLPRGLEGQVAEISMDDEHILALNSERQVYTMWRANEEVRKFRWQKAWGFPFWGGPGLKLRDDIIRWEFEVVSPEEDECWTDPAGNLHKVGLGKCSHIIMLNTDRRDAEGNIVTAYGQTMTFNDPWLPRDYSYEIATPLRGRFCAENFSSSGSTHFIINSYGDMYTRLFDFDISGLDALFMPCSYEDQTGLRHPRIQLPAEEWYRQPKIDTSDACITDRITIIKRGVNCQKRILRVEGTDENGLTGYYEKDIRDEVWKFFPTGQPLQGNVLVENCADDCSEDTVGPSEDLPPYVYDGRGFTARVDNFNCYSSPAPMIVTLDGGEELELVLHYRGTIRITPRERGINDDPRAFDAAIEVPEEYLDEENNLIDGLSDEARAFMKRYTEIGDGGRFADVKLHVTRDELRMTSKVCGKPFIWRFDTTGY